MNSTNESEKWQDEIALQRFQMISPLLDERLDPHKRQQLRETIAQNQQISIRTLFRYEAMQRQGGFTELKPHSKKRKPSPKLPEHYRELLQEAILLKREVPTRSINQIILILEMEGRVETGVLSRSTLQRHIYEAGFGKKQMKKYSEAKTTSSGRFVKPHRMMLLQLDIKYALFLPIGPKGKNIQTYFSAAIDDHSRFIVSSGFYAHQEASIVEDTLHKAILKYGKCDSLYTDNGKQYVSKQLKSTCAALGIRIMHAKPYVAKSKGKVEVLNRFVSAFLAEAKAEKVKTLEALNAHWVNWLEAYYHEKPHEELPDKISPRMAWNRDSRVLTFLDVNCVAEAFLHHEERCVDKAGCISFKGKKYEVGLSLIGATIKISYDPMQTQTLTVSYRDIPPFEIKELTIGEFCKQSPTLPAHLLPVEPENSRFLQGLGKKYDSQKQLAVQAISFGEFKKGGQS
jgi:hypothetical protein